MLREGAILAVAAACAAPALAIDQAHREKGQAMAARSIAWLRTQQDAATGGWAVNPGGPQFPAIAGLVLTGLLMEPGVGATDEAVDRGVKFMLSYRQPDGGIYDQVLPGYNTSICLSALAKLRTPMPEVIAPAQTFLRSLQYSEDAGVEGAAASEAMRVSRDHPFYGGVGYGKHGRPDNSNLGFMLEALHDTGIKGEDEAYQRALVFLSRTQMNDKTNDMAYADGSGQGGFIYATAPNKDSAGDGQSQAAGMIEETLDTGEKVSRLRAYGSMTYVGFKSYIYADLPTDDPRVKAATDWIARNYTLAENPGVGTDGMYYYFVTFARALDAAGRSGGAPVRDDTVWTVEPDGARVARDWANDLIDRLSELQNEDGSFKSVDDRWMEDNQVLITAYSLIALQHAAR
jgi:squalene-hopene/tetraprenyl-beta-curcumene cyclase